MKQGFTLLEMSLVVAVVGLVIAISVPAGKSLIESARVSQTNAKLDAIENALMAYRAENNRLPCPGDLSLAESNSNFGNEAATPGTCTGGSPAATMSGSSIVHGMVPFKKLNLPKAYAYDGWGSRIAYAAYAPATATNAFNSLTCSSIFDGILITNETDNTATPRTNQAIYILVSYGPDLHGAYQSNGTRTVVTGMSNNMTLRNCKCNSSAALVAFTRNYAMRAKPINLGTSGWSFDDIVRYKERWQMQTYDDAWGGCP